jgi:hypothetical protein
MREFWIIHNAEGTGSNHCNTLNEDTLCRPYQIYSNGKPDEFVKKLQWPGDYILIQGERLFATENEAYKAYLKELEAKIRHCSKEISFTKERLGIK